MSEPNVFSLGSTEFLMRLGTRRGVYVSVWGEVCGLSVQNFLYFPYFSLLLF